MTTVFGTEVTVGAEEALVLEREGLLAAEPAAPDVPVPPPAVPPPAVPAPAAEAVPVPQEKM